MFKILNPILLLVLIFPGIKSYSQNVNDSLIYWNENKKLKWSDFQYKGPKGKLNGEDVSISVVGISTPNSGAGYFKAYVYFSRNLSWTKDTISVDLLEHEQGHFDIDEIFARRLRKYFHDYEYGIIDRIDLNKVNIIKKERNIFQNQYDFETDHGTIPEEQKIWNELIRQELDKLINYKVDYTEYLKTVLV